MRKPIAIPVCIEHVAVEGDYEGRLERIAAPLRGLAEAEVRTRFELASGTRLLKTTLSLCAECLAHVPAAVYADEGRVWIAKQCAQHGRQIALLENDERFYRLSNKDRWGQAYARDLLLEWPAFDGAGSCCGPKSTCSPAPAREEWPHDFASQAGNKSCTVLVEITDACNLACRVCYAESAGDRLLPFEQFKETLSALIARKGVLDSVQVTGGEASLHPQFWEMLQWLAGQEGVGKIYLPTNGIAFAKSDFAQKLVSLRHKVLVLLQFDGTDRPTNQTLRRASPERLRIRLIEKLNRLGIAMQLTMTLSRGVSENDIAWVVSQGRRYRNVRLIAMQPAFFSGRYELDAGSGDRLTLSDCVKGVVAGIRGKTREDDFLPIPCSHPNCGWVTLYARRFGLFANIARHVDLNAVMSEVAYKTVLKEQEMQDIVGTRKRGPGGWLARAARRLIRPQDVFGIAIKPFMDRYNYDQDRISNCCHHMTDTSGNLVSFCEYNARLRRADSWQRLPVLEGHRKVTAVDSAAIA
jgi:7,8-dihydro-6-hydroxymethylpterin dimethyltransferase